LPAVVQPEAIGPPHRQRNPRRDEQRSLPTADVIAPLSHVVLAGNVPRDGPVALVHGSRKWNAQNLTPVLEAPSTILPRPLHRRRRVGVAGTPVAYHAGFFRLSGPDRRCRRPRT